MKNLSRSCLLMLGIALVAAPHAAPAQVKAAPEAAIAKSRAAADPRQTVPELAYRSAFAASAAEVSLGSTDWREANVRVGQYKRGHVDILKQELAEPVLPATPATPATPAASKPAPSGLHPHKH